jgi:hypothetical protein
MGRVGHRWDHSVAVLYAFLRRSSHVKILLFRVTSLVDFLGLFSDSCMLCLFVEG